jgi:hypothetical protein
MNIIFFLISPLIDLVPTQLPAVESLDKIYIHLLCNILAHKDRACNYIG